MKKKINRVSNWIFLVGIIISTISVSEYVIYLNYNIDSYERAGSIKRSLVPELFPTDAKGYVGFKIKGDTIYYRWSVFEGFDNYGWWPFIRKAESKKFPKFIVNIMEDEKIKAQKIKS